MFKVIGGLMVIVASTGLGFSFCEDLEKKIQILKEIRQMMIHIMNRIEAECDTLSEAFLHTAHRVKEPFSVFLNRVYERMKENEGCKIDEIWKEEATLLKEFIGQEEFSAFEICMEQTGFHAKEQQIQVVKEYILYLEKQIDELEKSKLEKCKVYKTLGILSGLLLVIILW